MRLPHIIIGTMAAGLLALGVVRAQTEAPAAQAAANVAALHKAEFRTTMRALWGDDAALTRSVFDSVLDMLSGRYPSDEFAELRPRLTWDRQTDVLVGRKGARLLSVVSGGTIKGGTVSGSGSGS